MNMSTRKVTLYTILALLAVAVLSMDAQAQRLTTKDEAAKARAAALETGRKAALPPRVNVNTATEAELAYLPGIGPKLASAINDYKESCCNHAEGKGAAFKSVDDLLKVKGIKRGKLVAIRPYVVLSGETTAMAKIRVPKAAKGGVK